MRIILRYLASVILVIFLFMPTYGYSACQKILIAKVIVFAKTADALAPDKAQRPGSEIP